MNQKLLDKIGNIYKEAKVLAEKYSFSDVWLNTGEKLKDISDEYAKQINFANQYRQKEKDLLFILSLLQEAKSNIQNTPRGQSTIKTIDTYTDNIKSLLNVYNKIDEIKTSILRYYDRGGATL